MSDFEKWWRDYARRWLFIHKDMKVAICKTFAQDGWEAAMKVKQEVKELPDSEGWWLFKRTSDDRFRITNVTKFDSGNHYCPVKSH